MSWISPAFLKIEFDLIVSIGCLLVIEGFTMLAKLIFYIAHRFPLSCWPVLKWRELDSSSLASNLAFYNLCPYCLNLNIHLSSRTRTLPAGLYIVLCDTFLHEYEFLASCHSFLKSTTTWHERYYKALDLVDNYKSSTHCMFTNIGQILSNERGFKKFRLKSYRKYYLTKWS